MNRPEEPHSGRPDWPDYFKAIVRAVATRSTCPRLAVGCILVRGRQIVSTGYNGAVTGAEHCCDIGCDMVDGHCVRAVHAEVNALLQAAKLGLAVDGCEAWVTHKPCAYCMKCLTNAGIANVHYLEEYGNAA